MCPWDKSSRIQLKGGSFQQNQMNAEDIAMQHGVILRWTMIYINEMQTAKHEQLTLKYKKHDFFLFQKTQTHLCM